MNEQDSEVAHSGSLAIRHGHVFLMGQKQVWRPQGDSNPRYRRERANSPIPCDFDGFVALCKHPLF